MSSTQCTFVAISDTHNLADRLTLPYADVLLHAGDATLNGKYSELERFVSWLKAQPHPTKIFCGGNHDLCLDASQSFVGRWAQGREGAAARADHARALELFTDESARAAGIVLISDGHIAVTPKGNFSVWGSAFVPEVWGGFNLPRGWALAERFASLADASTGVDIVLAHSPPARSCDAVCNSDPPMRRHVGSAELAAALDQRGPAAAPAVVVCGHIHEGFGCARRAQGTLVINAASLDSDYQLTHPPVLFALERGADGRAVIDVMHPTLDELSAWERTHKDPCLPKGVSSLADLPEEVEIPVKLALPPTRLRSKRPASADAVVAAAAVDDAAAVVVVGAAEGGARDPGVGDDGDGRAL